MKAADIPDQTFLDVVREFNEGRAPDRVIGGYVASGPRWALVWDMTERLNAPEKIIRAKARKLINRGLMEGCPCGCRGDFNVPGTPVSWSIPDPIADAIRRTN